MPSNDPKIAVVTGINGYIASVIGLRLLERGYIVRGTARSLESTDRLRKGAYSQFTSQFQPVEVPDIVASGAFDEVVKGAHVVIHAASPITFTIKTWGEFRDPAVKGTVGMLQSAFAHAGPQLASVVVTSSVTAIVDRSKGVDHMNTEDDWNNDTLDEVERLGDEAAAGLMYSASKVAAEKAVWAWVEKNKPSFAVSCVNPSLVIGPPVQAPETADRLNVTLAPVWNIFSGEAKAMPRTIGTGGYIDVRDVAYMHVWCAENPERARGQRFIGIAGHGPPQAQTDILRAAYPERGGIMPAGEPGKGYQKNREWPKGEGPPVSGRKAAEEMNFEYISLEQAVKDTAKVLERYL